MCSRYNKSYHRSDCAAKYNSKNGDPPVAATSLSWDCLALHKVHRSWLVEYADNACSINLKGNKINALPSDFFIILDRLEEMDLSQNKLKVLPSRGLDTIR